MKKTLDDEIEEQIEEEFNRLIDEDAILMGDVSNTASDIVPASSASISDNSVLKGDSKPYDHSITFKDTLGDYVPGDGVMSAKNNYTGNGLSAMNIQKRIPESEEQKHDFRKHFLESDIQGLENYSEDDLRKAIVDQILDRMNAANVTDDEAKIKSIAICGSRNRGTAKKDSDLDVVLEYSGTMREDDLFNILHDEDYEYGTMMIDDVAVDVNPIRKQESGSMKDFLRKSKEYDDYILSNQPLVEKKKKRRKSQHFRRYYGYYPFWPLIPVRPMPPPPPPGPPPPQPSPDIPSGGEVSGGDAPSVPAAGGDAGGAVAAGPVGENKILKESLSFDEIKKEFKTFTEIDLNLDIDNEDNSQIIYISSKDFDKIKRIAVKKVFAGNEYIIHDDTLLAGILLSNKDLRSYIENNDAIIEIGD